MSSSDFVSMALERYPVNDTMYPEKIARNLRLRVEYVQALAKCESNPPYYIRLPSGELFPCKCEPLMEDDVKGWKIVKRKIRVKREMTEEELEYLASTNTREYWENESLDSHGHPMQGHDHNGALFDIGARF
jgi:hypothetical protein